MTPKSALLRDLFRTRPLIRIVGAHNGLGAKLIQKNGFDGIWASGLEISTAHAVPDANILTMTEQLVAASAMNDASTLPVICDCDTGYGNSSNVIHMVRKYEAAGLAAVVIEDKLFPKVNSFVPGRQELAPVDEFMGKIEAAKSAQKDGDFMVFARVEALIAGWGMAEALKRAYAYAEAGADGIVIHSKAATPDEIYEFSSKWKSAIPLVAIPTTYPDVTSAELARRGFRMVIYANHGLRASMRAMDETFRAIRESDSTVKVEPRIASMKEVFEIQGMNEMKSQEEMYLRRDRLQAVIPAAADHRFLPGFEEILKEKPLCMLEMGGKTLIDRQMDLLRSAGVNDIVVVGGHLADKIRADGAKMVVNESHAETANASSFMAARDRFKEKCVLAYSDIVFDRRILNNLLTSPHQITLVIDRAYRSLPFRNKQLDLVVAEDLAPGAGPRRLDLNHIKAVRKIGQAIDRQSANYEFIGLAYFTGVGLAELTRAWDEARVRFKSKSFYEAASFAKADMTDLLQFVIDRGFPVHGLEIEQGWSEIHSLEDYRRVKSYFEEGAARASAS